MAFKRKKVVLKVFFFPFHRNIVLDLFVKSSSLLAKLSKLAGSFSMICSHFYKHQGGSRHMYIEQEVCTIQQMVPFTNPSMYNILSWVAWTMGQMNRRPSVCCWRYHFFHDFLKHLCKTGFNFFIYFLINLQK